MTTLPVHPTGRASVFVVVRNTPMGAATRMRSVVYDGATLAPNGIAGDPRAYARLLTIGLGFAHDVRKLLS